MPPDPNRASKHREGARFTRQGQGEAIGAGRVTVDRREKGHRSPGLVPEAELAELHDSSLDQLFFGDEEHESIAQAYERGRRDEREQAAPETRIDPDAGADPHGIGAWIAEAVQRPPGEPDVTRVFRLENPRGTRRKLDAVVRVQVERLPPRRAARALKELTAEGGIDGAPAPKRDDPAEAGPSLREE